MAIRITITDFYGRKFENFYKRVGSNIVNSVRGRNVEKCRIDVDIESKKDIEKREQIDNKIISFVSSQQ